MYIAAQSLQLIGGHYSKIHMLLHNNNLLVIKKKKWGENTMRCTASQHRKSHLTR